MNGEQALKQTYHNELEPQPVPYESILEALNKMQWGSCERLMFQTLSLIGCRPSELDILEINNPQKCFIAGNWIYWRPGKGQKGWRKEYLPNYWFKEFAYYRANNRVPEGKLFHIKEETFRAYFNKHIRPILDQPWQNKKQEKANFGGEYVLQIKGMRKTFATHQFFKLYRQWQDAGVALEMISKRMRHSRTNITCTSYIRDFEILNLQKWGDMEPWEILALANQRNLPQYDLKPQAFQAENKQIRLQEYLT